MTAVRPTDRLFFAILPDPATAARIGRLGDTLRRTYGLTGRPVLTPHLHITLWHVGDDYFAPSAEQVATLVRRAAYVEMPAFRISFDHVMSFRNGAFVLGGGDGVSGLETLHERLKAVMALPRLKSLHHARTFTPHMTLLRDEQLLPEQPIDPIVWTARKFVLVHSLLGRTTHHHLAHLPLA